MASMELEAVVAVEGKWAAVAVAVAVAVAAMAVVMVLADNSGNGAGRQQWWKQRQQRGQTTINQKAAEIVAETAVVAVAAAVAVEYGIMPIPFFVGPQYCLTPPLFPHSGIFQAKKLRGEDSTSP